jgi:hypothetical protein
MREGPWARKAARRRTGLHTIMALLFVAIAAGAAYLAIVLVPKWLKGPELEATATPSPSVSTINPLPGCQGPGFPNFAQLGTVAWVDSGALRLVDLSTCREKALVEGDASAPVRFSPDGKWIAYGEATLVRSTGGKTVAIQNATRSFDWSPKADKLVFVTKTGGVSLTDPRGAPQALLAPSAGKASHAMWSPNGKSIAVDLPDRILVIDVRTLEPRTVFTTTGPSPELAGWTPDSKWVLFWAKPLGEGAGKVAGRALDAVPAAGGDWLNVWDEMLPFTDFVTSCGKQVAIAGGGRRLVSQGKQILVTSAPRWEFHNVTQDYIRSWIWPSCSPDGKWMAVTAMPNAEESEFASGIRPLYVLRLGTPKREKVDPATTLGALEAPRWSRDGQTLLVIQRAENSWDSDGSLTLVEIDPVTGKAIHVADLGIDVGSAEGLGGHQRWNETTDWYRPPLPPESPSATPTPTPSPTKSSKPPPKTPKPKPKPSKSKGQG